MKSTLGYDGPLDGDWAELEAKAKMENKHASTEIGVAWEGAVLSAVLIGWQLSTEPPEGFGL